jgi:lysozyme
MKTSLRGINLIKSFEGLRLTAYRCSAGVPTIGYGHTKDVKMGDHCFSTEAEKLLAMDLLPVEKKLAELFPDLNQNQFDALVSFSFNLGLGWTAKSGLLDAMQSKDYVEAGSQMLRWCKTKTSKGEVITVPGLLSRRAKERTLFLSQEEMK